MSRGVYCIRNTDNNKVYIGSSRNIEGRWRVHRSRLNLNKHHSQHLQLSYNLGSSFVYEILELVEDLSQLEIREQYWVDHYQSYKSDFGYNAVRTVSAINPSRMRERWAKSGAKEKQSQLMKKVCNSKSWKQNTKIARQRLMADPIALAKYAKIRLLTSPHRKRVKCIETGQEFNSITQASKFLGVSVVKIRDSANKKRKSIGFSFEWVK